MIVEERKIWVCADDYGISKAVNAGIRELISRGRINATSVMVVAPSFDKTEAGALEALWAQSPQLAVGLHVTLTAPFQPLSSGYAPLKKDAFLSLAETLRAGGLRRLKPGKLTTEVDAQLRKFVDTFGRKPDFVDGHHHVQLYPQIREAVLKTVKERAPAAWIRQCGRATSLFRRLDDRKGLLLDILSRGLRAQMRKRGLSTNAAFAGTYDYRAQVDLPTMFKDFVQFLPGGGVLMCHPGHVDAELKRLDPLTTVREREYAYFASDAFPAMLKAQGVTIA